ncbi:MAG: ATP-binding protein [Candidatus Aminicenantes bacterium]|nr:ATP-binding protein [Candidatus Aminicenantes bacterium]
MRNPFRFGQLVKGENFCNRGTELTEIKKAINNNYSFWIYSPRRFGKTSLILKAFEELPEITTIYIDLYNVQSLDAFAEKYSQEVLKNLLDWKKNIKSIGKKISGFFKSIVPKISFDASGNPTITFEPQAIEKKSDIENILYIPEKIAAEQGRHICIAFDEFQEVRRIEPFLVNWMRSAFQGHRFISYVFLGSKQSLMETIFADTDSPFYEFGFKIPIAEISRRDWLHFLKEKFAQTGLEVSDNTLDSIVKKSAGHPHFTQYFASVVWELLLEGFDENEPGFTATWMQRIVAGQSIVFQDMFDQLNKNQRKILVATASLGAEDRLFSENYRRRFRLPATSTLSVNINSLLRKGMIYKKNGSYIVVNPVFKEWLINSFAA